MAQKKNDKGAKSHAKKKTGLKQEVSDNSLRKKREIQALVIIALGIFIAVAMFFDITGVVGEILSDFFKGVFGLVAFLLPFYLIIYGALMLWGRAKVFTPLATVFFVVLFFDLTIFNSVRFVDADNPVIPVLGIADMYKEGIALDNGGVSGMIIAALLVKAIGTAGAYIFAVCAALISGIFISDRPYSGMINWDERKAKAAEKRNEKREKKETENMEAVKQPVISSSQNTDERKQLPLLQNNAEFKKASKAIKKAKLADNQKRILTYMIDDTLTLGKGGSPSSQGFGIDGSSSEETLSGFGLNENYHTGDMGIPEAEFTGHYRDFSQEDEQEVSSVKNDTAEKQEKPLKEEKLTASQARDARLDEKEFNTAKTGKKYKLPPVSLLKTVSNKGADLTDIAEKTKKLENTLRSFNVDAKVVDVVPGPTVTRYEVHPNVGVKVSSIVKLSNDIALNLAAKSIRIEAPIPGKAAVGIEIENDRTNVVSIREIIDSKEFKNSPSKISFAVGKDISGRTIVGNLKEMPHLLIAGSTGSGKSVCINSIIASILYKAAPDEVKLVMIDPKVVELGAYNGIPHLLIPVVTEPQKAAAALNWAVAEMNERYKKFAEKGVRDLESYNESVKLDEEEASMPQIVIIIDELADLIMAAPAQVEESICRLAQMARAAGMHLIVATQRPSVNVITGVIKANIPSRIAFAVSSQADSRTILDMGGAEKLVGKGDMLYSPLGMGKPTRVQGNFISDAEVNNIINYVKEQVEDVEYSDDVINTIEKTDLPPELKNEDTDELLSECIELVVSSGQASVSMLQRRFRIGYNRAARIIDMMEERGIVGPQDGSRPRQVFMTEEEYNSMECPEE